MKFSIQVRSLLMAIGFLCLSGAGYAALAQCVGCAPAPPNGFVCVPTSGGGQGCITDGGSCTLVGACLPGNDGPPIDTGPVGRQAPSSCKLKMLTNPQVSIDESMIRAVAGADTRLAIALINVSKIRAEFTTARISFSSLDYTLDDVNNHLSQAPDSAYFREIRKQAGENLASGKNVISYQVSIGENRAGGTTLTVSPMNGKGASVDVELQRATFGRGVTASEGFKALTFQVR